MALFGCSSDLGEVERGDEVAIQFLARDGQRTEVEGLVVAWSEEIPALRARHVHLLKNLDTPFQTKYDVTHFYERPQDDRLETKD